MLKKKYKRECVQWKDMYISIYSCVYNYYMYVDDKKELQTLIEYTYFWELGIL